MVLEKCSQGFSVYPSGFYLFSWCQWAVIHVTILSDRLTLQNFPYIRWGLGRATSIISRPIQEAYLQQPSERAFYMVLSTYRKSNPIGFSFYSSLRLRE